MTLNVIFNRDWDYYFFLQEHLSWTYTWISWHTYFHCKRLFWEGIQGIKWIRLRTLVIRKHLIMKTWIFLMAIIWTRTYSAAYCYHYRLFYCCFHITYNLVGALGPKYMEVQNSRHSFYYHNSLGFISNSACIQEASTVGKQAALLHMRIDHLYNEDKEWSPECRMKELKKGAFQILLR